MKLLGRTQSKFRKWEMYKLIAFIKVRKGEKRDTHQKNTREKKKDEKKTHTTE